MSFVHKMIISKDKYMLVHLCNRSSWSVKRKALMELDHDPVFPWLPRDAPHGMGGRRQVALSDLQVSVLLDLQVNILIINDSRTVFSMEQS